MHINIDEFIQLAKVNPVIDVRSPSEFRNGHFPGALNIPVFNDEERAIVGTIYKNSGKGSATLKGLKIVGPKLSDIVIKVNGLVRSKTHLSHQLN